MTGVRFNDPGGGTDSTTDVPAGIGGGYTLGGVLDLKVQVRTERINDVRWTEVHRRGTGRRFAPSLSGPREAACERGLRGGATSASYAPRLHLIPRRG